MADWSHGYVVEVPYTYGYYKETSPEWIRFSLLTSGKCPPKGNRWRVLELGCGQGFNLCMHAALYPDYEFTGVDINPSHILHAEELVSQSGLKNIRFLEEDFVDLKERIKELGKFHYVILHGIWSWVSKPVRESIIKILDRVLLPGGVVYISYNSMPGWMNGAIIRATLKNVQSSVSPDPEDAVRKGIDILKRLMDVNALVYKAYPNLKNKVETCLKQDTKYLVHEYLHIDHQIWWVQDVVADMSQARLSFACSATLTDNYLMDFLPEDFKRFIREFKNKTLRLFLIDLFLNQAFRRDIFQRGNTADFSSEWANEVVKLRIIMKGDPPKSFKFKIPFGEVEGKRDYYEPLVNALSKEPKTVVELLKISPFKESGIRPLLQALTLLISADIVSFFNEKNEPKYTQKFNRSIVKQATEGKPYGYLGIPLTGLGYGLSQIEMTVLNCIIEKNCSAENLASEALSFLKMRGQSLLKDGKKITDPKEELEEMNKIATDFMNKKYGKLKELKAI